MYFHPRLLVVVGGIFGDLLGKYPSAKTPDDQQLIVENLMGTQVNKISKSDTLNSTGWKEKGEKKQTSLTNTASASASSWGLIREVWNGDGQAFNFWFQIEVGNLVRPYRGLKLVCLLAGWVDTFRK